MESHAWSVTFLFNGATICTAVRWRTQPLIEKRVCLLPQSHEIPPIHTEFSDIFPSCFLKISFKVECFSLFSGLDTLMYFPLSRSVFNIFFSFDSYDFLQVIDLKLTSRTQKVCLKDVKVWCRVQGFDGRQFKLPTLFVRIAIHTVAFSGPFLQFTCSVNLWFPP